MPSAIDITKPIYGTPTTQSVRDNFTIARDEITTLQDQTLHYVNKAGDTMTGLLTLSGPPYGSNDAATLSWVLQQLHSTINTLIYVGDYDGATDVILTSGQPQFIVGEPLPVASVQTSQYYFTVKTSQTPGVGNQPPEGVFAGTWLISNGVGWITYAMSAPGVTAHTVPISPVISNVPGDNVYDALAGIGQNFLLLAGGTLSNFLTLHAEPIAARHAATKKYIDDTVAGLVFPSEAPIDSFSYARANAAWSHTPTFDHIILNTDNSGHLRLNSSSASNTANQIVGVKDNVLRWALNLGNNAATQDFDIWRYNDTGSAYDTMPIFAIMRSTGNTFIRGSLIIDKAVGGSAPSISGRGPNNPTDPYSDTMNIWARNFSPLAGAVIGVRGPGYTDNPNGVDIYAGSSFNKQWKFGQTGTLTVPGSITMPISSTLSFDFSSVTTIYKDAGNNWVFNGNSAYRMYFDPNGAWWWQGSPNFTTLMGLNSSGDLSVTRRITANTIASAGDMNVGNRLFITTGVVGDFAIMRDTSGWRYIMFRTDGYALRWNEANGDWIFASPTNDAMWIHPDGSIGVNGAAYRPGGGPWDGASDIRVKKNVQNYTSSLNEICKLNAVSYQYNGLGDTPDNGETYYGIIAQQAREIMPELVTVVDTIRYDLKGQPLPRKPEMLEDQLGTNMTALPLALINAVRELRDRVVALERK